MHHSNKPTNDLSHDLHQHLVDLAALDALVNLAHARADRLLLLAKEHVSPPRLDAHRVAHKRVQLLGLAEVLHGGRGVREPEGLADRASESNGRGGRLLAPLGEEGDGVLRRGIGGGG